LSYSAATGAAEAIDEGKHGAEAAQHGVAISKKAAPSKYYHGVKIIWLAINLEQSISRYEK